jgi:pimeloyl-ACP methyl ester carboxylesterase
MNSAPIILVPGWWLGSWAWDEVAALLRGDGHDVTALTLPGLDSADADRSTISQSDHVAAIVEAVRAAPAPVVLAVHSGAGFTGYAASDRIPERIGAMVYVDTGAGVGAPDAEFAGPEKTMPPGSPGSHLRRPADQPLGHVVEAARAGRDHRPPRDAARPGQAGVDRRLRRFVPPPTSGRRQGGSARPPRTSPDPWRSSARPPRSSSRPSRDRSVRRPPDR